MTTMHDDVERLRLAWRDLGRELARVLAAAADRVLGGPTPLDDRTRSVVGIAQAGDKSSTRETPPAVRVNPTNGDGLTYAERVWLMAPSTPWTLDLIRAAWTDDEAVEAAERALRDEVDPEAIADALLAYVDQRDRRDDVEATAIVDEWAAGR
jgi:hypothetical protein